ncbi:hypothetical protein F2S74_14380 [Pseudomonas syringae pv. actinidiae]|nr:hypothetical protein [Pseudomonas syringae pv. actinidiae]NVL27135.1 hypothetical protein [Pseudomonas syringae pv. actinidiae]NVL31280.1 hypothetical protein [Pseudomonas syringae pv. actinidiae]NVL34102.1 hypothetical protein [Pseudomonas syringae pv. actinidiae]NVL39077.1 hypothetical protein [Pseudomonas syringae pv. actinidiae]
MDLDCVEPDRVGLDNELTHVNRVGRLKHASVSMGNRPKQYGHMG